MKLYLVPNLKDTDMIEVWTKGPGKREYLGTVLHVDCFLGEPPLFHRLNDGDEAIVELQLIEEE